MSEAGALRYELLAEIATGGMATVYLARQRGEHGFSRTVAIKSMHPQFAKDEIFRTMFLDEATISGRIRHPNVVATLDVASSTNKLLLVMEYVEGASLSALLRQVHEAGERMPLRIVSAIVSDLLAGLHAAHELEGDDGAPLGVVHRDVSPQNVIVGTDGLSRVLDFGVAKGGGRKHVTVTGEVKGKLGYMAPEQIFGEAVDRRSDVYACGVVLWEAIAGRRLFDAQNEGHIVKQVTEGRFSPPSRYADDLPAGLSDLVVRALSPDPSARFATADEMRKALIAIVPPATREDVTAFVRERASDELTARGQLLRSGAHKLEPDARAVLDVLTQTTRAEGGSESRRSRKRALTLGGGALALLVIAGASLALARSSTSTSNIPVRSPDPGRSTGMSTGSEGTLVNSTSTSTSTPTPTSTPPLPSIETAVAIPARTPKPEPAKKPAPSASAPAAPDCAIPYVVDAEGHRHYKKECLKP